MRKCLLFLFAVLAFTGARAGNKIKYYFNKPVDVSVSSGVNAIYLNNCAADTLAAYLGRAKYSLDICVYDFEKSYNFNVATPLDTVFAPEVAAAINGAYARGVKVRWIYEASNLNSGLSLIDTNIHTLGSPQGSPYNIMHNKFVVIDGNSTNPDDPIVWTGCMNWYYQQFNWDYNNIVIFQDSALAHAYTAEFNMMWGDTGIAPNLANSKFGPFKTDLGRHNFTIDGTHVELYFSPSDNMDAHIQSAILSADTDLYFGVFTFTERTDADDIVSKYTSGKYVDGIIDNTSAGEYPVVEFTSDLGSHFKVYTESTDTLYHNKFVIVDPSDTCSDPLVLTGSHNWSVSANTKNDENDIIIHNDTAANLYLQYFKATFNMLGGTLVPPHTACSPAGLVTESVPASGNPKNNVALFPNPSKGDITISYRSVAPGKVSISISNITGQVIATLVNDMQQAGNYTCNYTFDTPGVYFVRFTTGDGTFTKKVVIPGK